METLEQIRPKQKYRVIDLVEQAGLDVSKWRDTTGSPAANPKYCYEWAYVDDTSAVVLNLWHPECQVEDHKVVRRANFREDENVYMENGKPVWARRAKQVDRAIQTAVNLKLPVRVILLDGEIKNISDPDTEPSKVEKRELDPEFWHVALYNEATGDAVICRGSDTSEFVDQFTYLELGDLNPQRSETRGSSFKRDKRVREWVLDRAQGHCEFCGEIGFRTNNNKRYLETHHIISLADGGPDTVGNVIGLCPNHHRQAHFGVDQDELRSQFYGVLNSR